MRLKAEKKHTALGAIVTLKTAAGLQTRLHNPMTGFLSGNDHALHFGLGDAVTVEEIRVQWPSGRESLLTKQKAGRLLVIPEPAAPSAAPRRPGPPKPLFAERSAPLGLAWKHEDKPYDDYEREFLLPGKLSQFGPGLARGG